MLKVGW